jgi:hypothetical protein
MLTSSAPPPLRQPTEYIGGATAVKDSLWFASACSVASAQSYNQISTVRDVFAAAAVAVAVAVVASPSSCFDATTAIGRSD